MVWINAIINFSQEKNQIIIARQENDLWPTGLNSLTTPRWHQSCHRTWYCLFFSSDLIIYNNFWLSRPKGPSVFDSVLGPFSRSRQAIVAWQLTEPHWIRHKCTCQQFWIQDRAFAHLLSILGFMWNQIVTRVILSYGTSCICVLILFLTRV